MVTSPSAASNRKLNHSLTFVAPAPSSVLGVKPQWRDLNAQKTITAGRKSGNMKVLDQALPAPYPGGGPAG
jgi:hypothetical protein